MARGPEKNGLSAPADAIDRTATIHRCFGGIDYASRDWPRHQRDAGSYDAIGRIRNVLTVHHCTGLFSTCGYEPSYQQRR